MGIALRITVDQSKLESVKRSLRDKPVKMLEAVAGAINDTAKHEVSQISRMIRQKVNLKKDVVDKTISRSYASPKHLRATVRLSRTARISLKEFGARQTKKGVAYRIEKGAGLKKISDGFIVPTLGGHVFKREGKSRLPIRKLWGPSPWGVYVKNDMARLTEEEAQDYLNNRIEHRLQYQTKKRRGRKS